MRRRSTPRLLLIAGTACLAAASLATTPMAVAYWTAEARGSVRITAVTLASPEVLLEASGTTVVITLVPVEGQPGTVTHVVSRQVDGGTPVGVPCSPSESNSLELTCLDNVGTPETPVTYDVRTTLGEWWKETSAVFVTPAEERSQALPESAIRSE